MANKLTQEQFIEKATLLHNGFYNYNKVHYISARTDIDIICPLHGIFHQQPQVHLRGGGCPECKKLKISQNRLSNTQTFIKKANALWNGLYDYSKVEYNNLHEDIQIICPVHGEFWQRGTHHLDGIGCPKCNQSHLENDVKNLLQTNHIPFETQKHFDWLGLLSLDFYLPKQRIAIECQGGQHFRPIEYFGGEKSYLYQVERDNKKQSLCEEHNIKILYYSNKENLKGLTKKPDNIIIGLDLLQIILKGQVSADV